MLCNRPTFIGIIQDKRIFFIIAHFYTRNLIKNFKSDKT